MKDAIIIAVCVIILGGGGFVTGMMTTEAPVTLDTSKLTGDAKAKAEKTASTDIEAANAKKSHNEMMYGGIGAVVGLVAGAGVSAVMGKKK